MTREEKDLLLRDLCARLPYGVICKVCDANPYIEPLDITTMYAYNVQDITPYLRPMSSMTEDEKKEFDNFCVIDEFVWKGNAEIGYKNQAIIMSHANDWLNKKMFDYRGLIEKGLAIEVTKDNNPYKD